MSPARKRRDAGDRRQGEQRGPTPRRAVDRRRRIIDRIAIAVAVAIFAYGWWSLQHQSDRITSVVRDIQQQRRNNIYEGCVHDNAKNAAIRGFILASIPARRLNDPLVVAYIKRANTTFPTLDCRHVAARQAGTP